jgi:hypothetical protein
MRSPPKLRVEKKRGSHLQSHNGKSILGLSYHMCSTPWDRVSEIRTGPKGQVVGPREPSLWAPRSQRIHYFVSLGPMQNFASQGQPLMGEKYGTQKRKNENIQMAPMGVLAPTRWQYWNFSAHVSPKFCSNQNLILYDLTPMQNFRTLGQPLLGVTRKRNKKRNKLGLSCAKLRIS